MKKFLAMTLAFCLTLSALAGCGSLSGPEENADKLTMVKVGLTNSLDTIQPFYESHPYYAMVCDTIYQSLGRVEEKGSQELKPVIMSDYRQVDEYTYDITIYDYITDNSGNAITASDVVFSFKKAKESAITQTKYYDTIEQTGDYTVRLHMTTDELGSFLAVMEYIYIVSEKSYEESGDGMATRPVGTTQYVVDSYTPGTSVVLKKTDGSWQKEELQMSAYAANVDVIEFDFITETTQMDIALETDEVQIGMWVNANIVPDVMETGWLKLTTVPSTTTKMLQFNMMEDSPFYDNLALRQAVCYALDADAFVDALTGGYGIRPLAIGSPTQIGYNTDWETESYYPYDADKAKELLAEAGYEPGELTLTLITNNNNSSRTTAELIKAQLAMCGIEVRIDAYDDTTYTTYQDGSLGYYDMMFAGGKYGDYYTTMLGNLLDQNARESGRTKAGLKDDKLQEMYETVASVDGFTDENLAEIYHYIVDNCIMYQFCREVLIGIYNENIGVFIDGMGSIRVNACTYGEGYDYYYK